MQENQLIELGVSSAETLAPGRKTVRVLILSLVGMLWTINPALAQNDDQSKNENNLYWMALTASVKEMEKQWGSINVDGDERIRTDYRNMPIRQTPVITDSLPTESENYRFTLLGDNGLLERFKAQHKEYAVLEIHPVRNDGPRLRVQVSVSWVGQEQGQLMFAFSDWSNVEFEFDCKKQGFVISTVRLGGI